MTLASPAAPTLRRKLLKRAITAQLTMHKTYRWPRVAARRASALRRAPPRPLPPSALSSRTGRPDAWPQALRRGDPANLTPEAVVELLCTCVLGARSWAAASGPSLRRDPEVR